MDLVEHHFTSYGNTPDHICYRTFKRLFQELESRGPEGMRDLNILETGVAAWGTSSTYLFDAYVRKYGGRFWSVDVGYDTIQRALPHMCPATTTLVHQDSVAFLQQWATQVHPGTRADVVYLDSYDVHWDFPAPAADHGWREYLAVRPVLRPGSLLLIDDTPVGPEVFEGWAPDAFHQISRARDAGQPIPGKGMHVLASKPPATVLDHWYQVLYRF